MRQLLRKVHETQGCRFFARIAPLLRAASFAIWVSGAGAAAFTPEAENLLSSLRRRVAEGEIGEEAYARFVEELTESSACENFSREDPDLRPSVEDVCADAEEDLSPTGSLRLALSQSAYPRAGGLSAPAAQGAGRASWGAFDASLREGEVYRRLLRVEGPGGVSLLAGHLYPAFADTRIDFVAGRPRFAGWSPAAGPEDGLASSEYPALDGLGARYETRGWRAGGFATWNRLVPPGGSGKAVLRRDAAAFAVGAAHRRRGWDWRVQAVRQRFETGSGTDSAEAVTVAGCEARGPGSVRLGFAVSALEAAGYPEWQPGAFLRAGWGYGAEEPGAEGSRAGYALEAWQADPGWANPLSASPSLDRDTVGETLRLPGRGEGGFDLRSRLTGWEKGSWRGEIASAGGAKWDIRQEGLMSAEGRLSLTESWGAWTHRAGMALSHRMEGVSAPRGEAWGQSVEWKRAAWSARGSLWQSASTDRREGSLSLARRAAGTAWQADASMDDILNPELWRLALRQTWGLGAGGRLVHSVRVPLTEEGVRSDFAYKLELIWTGF
jgi:hypothetical protein